MITLKLPDGSTRQVAPGSRSRDVAESIGKRLAQAAIAAKVNGEVVDLDREIGEPPALAGGVNSELSFQVLTDRDPEALEVLRHSSAHIMARAVMRLFPGTQLAFGPALANGFYYDIDSPTPLTEADFPKIEVEMKKIIAAAEPFERFERSVPEGRGLCDDLKQQYKVEHIDEELKKYPTLSFYRQGEFIDLCRGPHIPNAGKVGAFKLVSIAGAYWKNDANRKMLQRLYATAFFNEKDLKAYLEQLEEAKKRDHRTLGKQLKLFTISEAVGQGLILWMPKGAMVRSLLETFIKDELLKRGYSPVYTPHVGKLGLYETSGHYPHYKDSQFAPMFMNPYAPEIQSHAEMLEMFIVASATNASTETDSSDGKIPGYETMDDKKFAEWSAKAEALEGFPFSEYQDARNNSDSPKSARDRHNILVRWLRTQDRYLLKPMNCPHHIHIFKAMSRSYRDLPIRLAEFGTVYRFEQSGELGGLTRVRGFTQDDAHLFVTPEQVESELIANLELVFFVLKTLSLNEYRVRVGVRDPNSNKYVGPPELWEKAEKTLIDVAKKLELNYSIGVGEAAFYGPKIDFIVKDCVGRDWQLGTVQLDYNLPERFDLDYIGADNHKHRPVMIHRAPFGSMERFCGILIEHFAGAFPLWLAPEQARIVTVSDKFTDYGKKVEDQLKAAGFRVSGDYRPEKIGAKIRDGSLEKIPYLLIVGDKEQSAGTVAVRDESIKEMKQRDIGSLPIAEVIARFKQEIDEKRVRQISTASAGLADSEAKYGG